MNKNFINNDKDNDNLNIDSFNFSEPEFDSKKYIYVSQFVNGNQEKFKNIIKNMMVLGITELDDKYIIQTEFLPSENKSYEFFNKLDEKAKTSIINNGVNWLGIDLDNDAIDNLFKKSINIPNKIPALPYINFIINKKDNNIDCKIKSKKRKTLSINDIKPNNEIQINFVVDGINFYKNKCNILYCVSEIHVINELCQSFECLINDD